MQQALLLPILQDNADTCISLPHIRHHFAWQPSVLFLPNVLTVVSTTCAQMIINNDVALRLCALKWCMREGHYWYDPWFNASTVVTHPTFPICFQLRKKVVIFTILSSWLISWTPPLSLFNFKWTFSEAIRRAASSLVSSITATGLQSAPITGPHSTTTTCRQAAGRSAPTLGIWNWIGICLHCTRTLRVMCCVPTKQKGTACDLWKNKSMPSCRYCACMIFRIGGLKR